MKDLVNVVDVRLADIRPWDRNPKLIRRPNRAALQASLHEFGYVQPIILNSRGGGLEIITGHQRAELLLEAGVDRVRCVVLDLPPAKAHALAITLDNPEAQGEFTDEVGVIIEEIRAEIGSDAMVELRLAELRKEVAAMPDPGVGAPGADPDAIPEPPRKSVAKRGDLWILGEHRLVCGDATDRAQVARALGGRKADLVFTDPPYNLGYESEALGGILNDSLAEAEFIRLILAASRELLASLRPGGSWYICMSAEEAATVKHQLRKLGMPSRQIVWAKPCAGLGSQDYRPEHEVLLYGTKEPRSRRTWTAGRMEADVWSFDPARPVVARAEGRGMVLTFGSGLETVAVRLARRVKGQVITFAGDVSDVWRFARERGGYVHPTQKPVALVERALANSTRKGDLVLDAFAGGGTTLMGCERLGRRAACIELDPKFVDVTVERWQGYTGGKARKEAG